MAKVITFEELTSIKSSNPKSTIGLCHGVFDLVHLGHMHHFINAKSCVDVLVVSVTVDKFVNKGPGRPLNTVTQRLEFLCNINAIDFVVESPYPTSAEVINSLQPLFTSKAKSIETQNDLSGEIYLKKAVENHGGTIQYTEGFTDSSTRFVRANTRRSI